MDCKENGSNGREGWKELLEIHYCYSLYSVLMM